MPIKKAFDICEGCGINTLMFEHHPKCGELKGNFFMNGGVIGGPDKESALESLKNVYRGMWQVSGKTNDRLKKELLKVINMNSELKEELKQLRLSTNQDYKMMDTFYKGKLKDLEKDLKEDRSINSGLACDLIDAQAENSKLKEYHINHKP